MTKAVLAFESWLTGICQYPDALLRQENTVKSSNAAIDVLLLQ